jgi:hypothetical protein
MIISHRLYWYQSFYATIIISHLDYYNNLEKSLHVLSQWSLFSLAQLRNPFRISVLRFTQWFSSLLGVCTVFFLTSQQGRLATPLKTNLAVLRLPSLVFLHNILLILYCTFNSRFPYWLFLLEDEVQCGGSFCVLFITCFVSLAVFPASQSKPES